MLGGGRGQAWAPVSLHGGARGPDKGQCVTETVRELRDRISPGLRQSHKSAVFEGLGKVTRKMVFPRMGGMTPTQRCLGIPPGRDRDPGMGLGGAVDQAPSLLADHFGPKVLFTKEVGGRSHRVGLAVLVSLRAGAPVPEAQLGAVHLGSGKPAVPCVPS